MIYNHLRGLYKKDIFSTRDIFQYSIRFFRAELHTICNKTVASRMDEILPSHRKNEVSLLLFDTGRCKEQLARSELRLCLRLLFFLRLIFV